ncbi:glycerol transporter [Coprinopsis marcescibilis]|uniref:Glycerol transporter n=1 Tax=Coprinopsis marcescibilis TaxID=230819 RepID=A0A5C3KFE5_COPMA|nr:glycerol transporter [Coprinopsis marcescibilis]
MTGGDTDTELPTYSPKPANMTGATAATPNPQFSRKRAMRITDLTVDVPSGEKPLTSSNKDVPVPSRWSTLEFKFYYFVVGTVLPVMIWIPIALSSSSHPNYGHYAHRLRDGWMFGRKFDNSDIQYRSFRGNLIPLALASLLMMGFKAGLKRIRGATTNGFMPLIPYNVAFSILAIIALHGTSTLKLLGILSINFLIAKHSGSSKLGPILTWIFCGIVLFSSELYHGYSFGSILPSLRFLDSYPGIYPRWHIIFNITMLRLVSFNTDYYWALQHKERAQPSDEAYPNEKQRQDISHPYALYSFLNYLAYALYPPLYIAGPIMTFNDFMWQHRRPIKFQPGSTLKYLFRFIICFLTMEFILHFMYVVAIKEEKAWQGATPAQISMVGFWNLIVVWLKLLIPWRFFRLWAMMDGILAPENMIRCMANNYSVSGFWRSWHRSYNLWLIRYIYVPLGGSKNVIFNTLLVFSFVALWHDLQFRLLAWGWLISVFIIPELLAAHLLPKSKFGKKSWYRHVCAVGAVFNILMLMAANLVGFVVGADGINFLLSQLFGTAVGVAFLLFSCFCIFVTVQIMFEYREEELRHGIYRRC